MKTPEISTQVQPTLAKGVVSPEFVLQATIRALPELNHVSTELFDSVPQARRVALRLCEYLMQAVPASADDDASLLERCFETGLRSVHLGRPDLAQFVRGLLLHVHGVAAWHVFARRRNHTISWDCCTGSLHSWLVGNGSPRLRIAPRPIAVGEDTPTSLTRAIIACRVLCPEDIQQLGPAFHSVVFADA